MTISILSSRDADTNINISLSFTVSHGPPSRIHCQHNSMSFINTRDPDPRITREVIRSRYISSDEPDMTRVTVRPDPQPRVGATYFCEVEVESRTGIASGTYSRDRKGVGQSFVTLTGE